MPQLMLNALFFEAIPSGATAPEERLGKWSVPREPPAVQMALGAASKSQVKPGETQGLDQKWRASKEKLPTPQRPKRAPGVQPAPSEA